MLKKIFFLSLFVFYAFCGAAFALDPDEMMDKVISKYGFRAFSASFVQTTSLKSMDMTDKASGYIIFKPPYKMCWKYYTPEVQEAVSDGKTFWIYNEKDNQVTTGKAEAFFKNGRGGSFLTDIKNLRKNFEITPEGKIKDNIYRFRLLPVKENPNISSVYLLISAKSLDIVGISTYNAYDDENSLEFKNVKLLNDIPDSEFDFIIPKGAEVIRYEEGAE
ncbi:MAG: outer membrane lipoprotein carrier protein LolA [Deltaproteobacteria bacterium]|nr:outer membrane lipoprotein carrier protein LolA [Deltaproteobacteria bacterium]